MSGTATSDSALTRCFFDACHKSDAQLVRQFNDYLAAMPTRLVLTPQKEVTLAPCPLRDATMLLVLGLRLANRKKPHPDLESIRDSFGRTAEAFEVFAEAEAEGLFGLGILKQEFGEFAPRHRQLLAEMNEPFMSTFGTVPA